MITIVLLLSMQAPHDSLTLHAALVRARQARGAVPIASATVAEARGDARAASALPNPVVSYSHSESFPVNHLGVEQSLDWILTRGAATAQARALVDRARADSAGQVRALDRDVRLAYWQARAAAVHRTMASDEGRQADSLVAIATARYRAGAISQLETDRATLEAARAHVAESAAREADGLATAALMRALGDSTDIPPPTDPLDTGLDSLPDLDSRHDLPALRAALADSAAAAEARRAAALGRVPMPSLQAGSEWGDPGQPGSLLLFGLSVPLPIWNQGGGTVAVARARADRAAAAASEARLEAHRMVQEARIQLVESARRARLGRDSLLPAATRIRSKAIQAYSVGETDLVAVIDALRNERDVATAVVSDELAFQEARTEWLSLSTEE